MSFCELDFASVIHGLTHLSCRFVLMHLPGIKVKVLLRFLPFCKKKRKNLPFHPFQLFLWQEIEEMIITVDKNQDGKISYSEFRVRRHFS